MTCFRVVVVVLLSLIADCAVSQDCFGFPTKLTEEKQPLFLRNDENSVNTFIIPKNGRVALKEHKTFLIACPNPKNFLVDSNSTEATGECVAGKFKLGNRHLGFDELQCNKSIRGDIKATNKRCGNNEGYLTNIGYYIGRKEFLTLIEICYDADKGNTLYAEHIVHGESIKNASHTQTRPSFSPLGLGPRVGASVAYKQAFQKGTFNKLLGSSALADLYINSKSYLSRGHLAPDADFLFAAWQFTTYFYINACPQWQVINAGNWHRVESMVRKTAEMRGENLRVITGTYGVLALPDINGNMVDLYLVSENKLPVPEYTYKILYSHNKREAIVLIILNNPFVQAITQDDYFCKSVCEATGWGSTFWTDIKRGVVHCCNYSDFAKIVHTVPKIDVINVLKGPNSR